MSAGSLKRSAAEAIEALVVSARDVARAALELEQLIERAVQLPDVLVRLLRVEVDVNVDATSAAMQLRLSAEVADGLDDLISTVRARHADLLIVQADLAHRFGSLVGFGDPMEPRVGGAGQTSPAEGGGA